MTPDDIKALATAADMQGLSSEFAELLAALDEAQQDAARLEALIADFSPMGLDANGNHAWAYRRNFSLRGPNMRAAIDAGGAA